MKHILTYLVESTQRLTTQKGLFFTLTNVARSVHIKTKDKYYKWWVTVARTVHTKTKDKYYKWWATVELNYSVVSNCLWISVTSVLHCYSRKCIRFEKGFHTIYSIAICLGYQRWIVIESCDTVAKFIRCLSVLCIKNGLI